MKRHCCALVIVISALHVAPAQAQSLGEHGRGCNDVQSSAVKGTVTALTRMPDKTSLAILGVGAAAALGAHAADTSVTRSLSGDHSLDSVLKPGATLGGMPLEVGVAAALMSIGKAADKPCVGSLGSELLQAQLVGAAWTIGIKEIARRSRPEGTGYSFPSGHTATAFASATVLQHRFGWKAGIPAYALATYVGASRIQMQRHYLSDVAFGAALGIVAGRSVSVGHEHRLVVGPMASLSGSGGGIGFSLVKTQ